MLLLSYVVPEPINDHLMAFNGTGLIKGSLLGYSKPVAIKPLKQIWFVHEPITFGLYGYIKTMNCIDATYIT